MPARITAATVAAVAILAPVLVSCGGSTDPGPKGSSGTTESTTPITSSDPPTTTSPTTTKPTGAVEPSYPDAAKANTRNGARAFARYYIAVASYAQVTGDTETLHRLGLRACSGCTSFAGTIDDTYGAGGWLRSKALSVLGSNEAKAGKSRYRVDLAIYFPDQRWKRSADVAPKFKKAARRHFVAYVIWKERQWLVYQLGGP